MKLISSKAESVRPLSAVISLFVLGLLAAGCGGSGKDIGGVRSCLEDLKLTVESSPEDDADVKEGVFATTDLSAGIADSSKDTTDQEFTFALAAIVKDKDSVDKFEAKSKDFAKSASSDGKLEFESGTHGDYVWVAGGEQGSDSFDKVKDCVKP